MDSYFENLIKGGNHMIVHHTYRLWKLRKEQSIEEKI
jgi:hypothetical protein